MKNLLCSVIVIGYCVLTSAQITVGPSILPDVGEQIDYTTFVDFDDSTSYRNIGEDLTWHFDQFNIQGPVTERYQNILDTDLADSFPDANMVISIAGFQSAAVRTDSTIEVIGLVTGDFTGFGIESKTVFEDPYLFRKTPLTYGDSYGDAFDFVVQFASELIPGLDTFPVPIPGTTLDSIRITVTVGKFENVTAWGTLEVPGDTFDVLKIDQIDSTRTMIEVGLRSILGFVWLDATALIGDLGIDQSRKTYKFLNADSKASILEFNENGLSDSTIVISGRISAEIISKIRNPEISDDTGIYPNPANTYIQLQTDKPLHEISDILIIDQIGRPSSEVKLRSDATIDISGLAVGNYYFIYETDHRVRAIPFVISR